MEVIARRYTAVRTLGQGAMGAVLLVRDAVANQEVALKVIAGAEGEKSLLQFKQEFRQMTQLHHPHCCRVYDYGETEGGAPYFTMEVVPGKGLDELLPLDEGTFRQVFAQLLLALGYVHQLGFVHLDLKGANVRVRPDGTVKLMDFGLMERAGHPLPAIRGTLPYLAPEVIKRAPVDGRTDLYAAGALAYELLTGRPPFVAEKPMEVLRAHLEQRPAPMRGVDPELERVVMRLLAKEPLDRFASASEVMEALGYEPPPGLGGSLLGSPMVGRDAELALLRERLAEVAAGRAASPTWITGMAGIGKSRLLDEFRCQAQLEGLTFVRGASHEHGRAPYAPLAAILRALLPAFQTHVPERLAAEAPVLVALLPELGVAQAAPMEAPRAEMLRLQAAATGLLTSLAARQPFVMLLEDWRGADASTRDFLAYFLRNMGAAPIMLLVSTRRGPEAGDSPEGLVPVALGGLAPAALAPMLENMLATRPLPPAFVAGVATLTGGNPYRVEVLLDELVHDGRLARVGGKWGLDLDWQTVELRERALDLPPDAVLAARALAVYGLPAGLERLQALTGLAEEPFFAALDALVRAQVLAPDDEGRYGFGRRELAVRFHEETPAGPRREFHAAALALLEAELAGRAAADASLELVTALATHALAGGARHAAGYALEAARRSLALFALADATRFAEAGLPLVRQAGDRHAELAFMQLLGEIRRFAGQPEAALSLLEPSLTLAQELGETALQGPLLATLGKACLVLSRYEEAQAYCRRAADACLAAGDPSGAARALLADARGSFFRGQVDVAKATCTRALELAQQGQAGSVLAQVLAYAGYLYVASEPEKLADGVGYLERAVALLEPLGDRPGLNDAYVLLGNAQLALGDFKEARASFERCRAIARECGLAEEEAFALVNLAIADLELGAFERAREAAAEARARSAELGIQLPLGMAIALEASAAARLGRLAAADALFAEALAVAARIGNKYLEATILPYQVEVLAFLGRGPEALAVAGRLRALIQETGNTEPEGKLDALEASLLVGAGRPNDARAALARALAAAIATKAKGLHALARLADARRAYAAGAWTEARTTAEAALADVRALGYRYLEGELLALAGHAALAGGLGGPKAPFEALAAVAEETGCGLHAALASFGLAAAEPYGPEATARAARAKALLEAFGAELAAEQRAAFLAEPERKRVLEGNFIAASLPAPRQKSNTGPLGLHMRGSGPL